MSKEEKIKKQGEVFTPNYIVEQMLDFAGYSGKSILKKHVIDNSCGEGAILETVVKRYCYEYHEMHGTYDGVKKELETYIHGIEIDRMNYESCIRRLNIFIKSNFNIDSITSSGKSKIHWDIVNGNTLEICDGYYGKIDYVFGNPPYVRIHNIPEDDREFVKKFSFMGNGMSDLYIAFYEVGINMMSENGRMCYISSNSWMSSVAATKMRGYISEHGILSGIVDFGHFQPFKGISTYVSIFLFDKKFSGDVSVYELCHDGMTMKRSKDSFCVAGKKNEFVIGRRPVDSVNRKSREILVKNGICTLSDKIFITDSEIDCSIKCIKASTGKCGYMIYPYDECGNAISEDDMKSRYPDAYSHLIMSKEYLENRSIIDKKHWYLFGRTQAIKDTFKYKIAINQLFRDSSDCKINVSEPGTCVYGGLYIINNGDSAMSDCEFLNKVTEMLISEEFTSYVKSLRHYKSGGYYAISSMELENYLNGIY